MAIKTISHNTGTGTWSAGWHTLTISKAEYGDWNGTKFLDVCFDGYSENMNMRVYAKEGKNGEEFAIGNVFRFANAGISDGLEGADGNITIKLDDSAEALIGKEMRKNTFQKMLSGEDIVLTSNTVMNYILYEDILDAIEADYNDTKVLRSNDNITIGEVVDIFEKKLKFGEIHYEVEYIKSDIDTNKTSKENIRIYKEKYA